MRYKIVENKLKRVYIFKKIDHSVWEIYKLQIDEKKWTCFAGVDDLSKKILNPAPKGEPKEAVVYEILYEYFNREVSLAYPHPVPVSERVIGHKYFRTKRNCSRACNLINSGK